MVSESKQAVKIFLALLLPTVKPPRVQCEWPNAVFMKRIKILDAISPPPSPNSTVTIN